jgi:predicted ATPase
MVLGCYRDVEVARGHPLPDSLAQLSRSPFFQRTGLAGLAAGDIGPYIQAASGVEPSRQLISALHDHTDGNPLFLGEVIRLLAERGELDQGMGDDPPAALGISQGVLQVIGQRLNRLSADCGAVLTTAAVIGRQFDFNVLESLSEDISESRLLELVEEALAAHIIGELPGQGDHYQFSHALVQQTLLEGLSTSRKVRLHARISEVLETLFEDHLGEHAAELAYHFS